MAKIILPLIKLAMLGSRLDITAPSWYRTTAFRYYAFIYAPTLLFIIIIGWFRFADNINDIRWWRYCSLCRDLSFTFAGALQFITKFRHTLARLDIYSLSFRGSFVFVARFILDIISLGFIVRFHMLISLIYYDLILIFIYNDRFPY